MTQAQKPVGPAAGPGAGDAVAALFEKTRAVIGVVHLAPPAGAPRYGEEAIEDIYRQGLDDARDILDIVDGVIVASALKYDGVWWNRVEKARVAAFIAGLGA